MICQTRSRRCHRAIPQTHRKKPAASKRPPGEHNFPLAGLITLALILGLALFVAQIPTWNKPKQTAYVCSTSIATSVGGIAPGSAVLVGGIECGQVTTITTVLDATNGDPSEIEISFQLNSDIPVRMDAVLRKYVGISGSNGSLNFDNLGTPAHAFEAGQRRDLPLSVSASGPRAFIGQRAASHITKAQYLANLFDININNVIARSKDRVTSMQGDLKNLLLRIPADVKKWKTIVNRITSGTPGWSSRWRMMVAAFDTIQMAFDPVGAFMTWIREEATISLGNSMNNARLARSNMESLMDQGTELQERFTVLGNMSRESIDLGEKTLNDLQALVPEVQTSLQQTFARGTLAGGQLFQTALIDPHNRPGCTAVLA